MSTIKKILIVEDEKVLREAIFKKMNKAGFMASVAETGEEAKKKVAKEDFGLVLLDLMLPEMSGEEVLKFIRENKKTKDLPVIVISAKGDEATISHCLNNLGANDYLTKSECSLGDILERVEKFFK